jgi:cytochrome oxidase assembly protein ShyY1
VAVAAAAELAAGVLVRGTCYTMLTPWQFGRDPHRKQQNADLGASSNATPLQLDTVLSPAPCRTPAYSGSG